MHAYVPHGKVAVRETTNGRGAVREIEVGFSSLLKHV
jgi:hypothetical protein